MPQILATMRLAIARELPARQAGLTGARLPEGRAQPEQTAEQKMRGGDATEDRVLLIGGYDEQAVKTAAREGVAPFYGPAYSLSAAEL